MVTNPFTENKGDTSTQDVTHTLTEEILYARPYYCALAFEITHDYHVAEEVSQEAFYKALTALQRLERGSLYKVENPRAWLSVIVKHTAIDHLRRQAKFTQISLDASEVRALQASRFARPDVVVEGFMALEYLFDELSERDKWLLKLSWGEERTIEEIAELVSLTPSATKTALHRARKRFLKLTMDYPDIEREEIARWITHRQWR